MTGLFLGVLAAPALLAWGANLRVNAVGEMGLRELHQLEPASTALVLGAYVDSDGSPCPALEDRLETALELYQRGLVKTILLSGDSGAEDYDEVEGMLTYLLSRGLPKDVLIRDDFGLDTYDSMYRAKKLFGVSDVIVVSQDFHLRRALYLGTSMGLECQGFRADKRTLLGARRLQARDSLAKVKAVVEVFLGRKSARLER